jgi:hypothetical protein
MRSLISGNFGIWWGIVGIYGPWEFSPTWEVEGNAPQLKGGTLLHVTRNRKRGGRPRATYIYRTHAYFYVTCDLQHGDLRHNSALSFG